MLWCNANCHHCDDSDSSSSGEQLCIDNNNIVDPTVFNKPRYSAIRWGDFRTMRYLGDYADIGEEIQIEQFIH